MEKIKALLLLFILASCGPVMQTSYEIVPPTGRQGHLCANNCLLAKTNCDQTCLLGQMNCRARAERWESQNEFLQYLAVQGTDGRPVYYPYRRSTRYYDCSTRFCEARCMNNYHICHTNCGGKVIPHTYCTAFCN